MASLSCRGPRLGRLLWVCLSASALLLLACAGDETGTADLGSAGLTGDDGTQPVSSGPLCGGQVVPSGDYDLTFGGYSGDAGFKVQDWSVEEFNLISGSSKTLFSLDNHADGSINAFVVDDGDLYAVTDAELYRFDRTLAQLSLISRAPDSSVEPALGTTTFAPHLSLSSTQVLTQPYYYAEKMPSGDTQLNVYLGLFTRPGGDLDLVPVNRRDFLSYAGDTLFFIQDIADDNGQHHNEIDTYDPSSDSIAPLAAGYVHYAFVGDTLWYTLRDGASSFGLYRVPVQGGTPELVQSALAAGEFVTNGTQLYLMLKDPISTGSVLTEFDMTSDASRSLGGCSGLLVHASAGAVYVYQPTDTSTRAVRIPL